MSCIIYSFGKLERFAVNLLEETADPLHQVGREDLGDAETLENAGGVPPMRTVISHKSGETHCGSNLKRSKKKGGCHRVNLKKFLQKLMH